MNISFPYLFSSLFLQFLSLRCCCSVSELGSLVPHWTKTELSFGSAAAANEFLIFQSNRAESFALLLYFVQGSKRNSFVLSFLFHIFVFVCRLLSKQSKIRSKKVWMKIRGVLNHHHHHQLVLLLTVWEIYGISTTTATNDTEHNISTLAQVIHWRMHNYLIFFFRLQSSQ